MGKSEKETYLASIPKADTAIEAEAVDYDKKQKINVWYALKDTLLHRDPWLVGNFINLPGAACSFNYTRVLPLIRIEEIVDLRPCDHGEGHEE
jgi:hypothetical protein